MNTHTHNIHMHTNANTLIASYRHWPIDKTEECVRERERVSTIRQIKGKRANETENHTKQTTIDDADDDADDCVMG